jgi:hypothetical protein
MHKLRNFTQADNTCVHWYTPVYYYRFSLTRIEVKRNIRPAGENWKEPLHLLFVE